MLNTLNHFDQIMNSEDQSSFLSHSRKAKSKLFPEQSRNKLGTADSSNGRMKMVQDTIDQMSNNDVLRGIQGNEGQAILPQLQSTRKVSKISFTTHQKLHQTFSKQLSKRPQLLDQIDEYNHDEFRGHQALNSSAQSSAVASRSQEKRQDRQMPNKKMVSLNMSVLPGGYQSVPEDSYQMQTVTPGIQDQMTLKHDKSRQDLNLAQRAERDPGERTTQVASMPYLPQVSSMDRFNTTMLRYSSTSEQQNLQLAYQYYS